MEDRGKAGGETQVRRLLAHSLMIFSFLSWGLAATGPVTGGYHIDHGDNAVIDAHGTKKKVTNNHASGLTIYVPTNTSTEWSTYVAKPPPGVTIEDVSICPSGYVQVPAMAPYTTQDFCVAKYEMKNVGGVATSQAAGTPWVNIDRNNARTQCSNLGTGYSLITNAQWQTIARNITEVAANWSGKAVGSGALNRGHSDNSPASALQASADDTEACFGTDQTCSNTVWHDQRRTHVLSNGEVIWDFAGNVWEWVYDDYNTLGVSPAISSGWNECNTLSETNRALFCPSNGTWTSAQGIGQIRGGSAGAVLRGGRWDGGTYAGVFLAHLDHGPTYSSTSVGFRCVFVP